MMDIFKRVAEAVKGKKAAPKDSLFITAEDCKEYKEDLDILPIAQQYLDTTFKYAAPKVLFVDRTSKACFFNVDEDGVVRNDRLSAQIEEIK